MPKTFTYKLSDGSCRAETQSADKSLFFMTSYLRYCIDKLYIDEAL